MINLLVGVGPPGVIEGAGVEVSEGSEVAVAVGFDVEVGWGVAMAVKVGRNGAGVAGKAHRPGSLPVGVKPTAQRQVLSTSANALSG
jgi:hypothetical protein